MPERQLKRERAAGSPYRRGLKRSYISVGERSRKYRGTKIYAFRLQAGLTRMVLADLMYVTSHSILQWERGVVEPKELAWRSFQRVQRNWRQKLRRAGVDADGGPFMEEE